MVTCPEPLLSVQTQIFDSSPLFTSIQVQFDLKQAAGRRGDQVGADALQGRRQEDGRLRADVLPAAQGVPGRHARLAHHQVPGVRSCLVPVRLMAADIVCLRCKAMAIRHQDGAMQHAVMRPEALLCKL